MGDSIFGACHGPMTRGNKMGQRVAIGTCAGGASAERITRDLLVMGAVPGEVAFEQGELGHFKRVRREAAVAFKKIMHRAAAPAFPAGEGDVRMKGAALGLEAILLADALDLGGEGGDRCLGMDACPQRTATALLEAADASDA